MARRGAGSRLPEPEFAVDGFVTVTFRANPVVRPVAEQVTGEAASPL